ncbi:flagellin hook IN motif-containing protein, partial [Campylobacter sp. MIT 97-5078]
LAEEINRVSDRTGVRASFNVTTTGLYAIQGGTTSTDFAINGTTIGAVKYEANDKNGSLVQAINAVKDTTGVEASLDEFGKLVLKSNDGRGIVVTSGNMGAGSGIVGGAMYNNYGRLSLVKNNGQDIAISGTGFGFSAGFISQASVSLRESKGTINAENADAMGFYAEGKGKRVITQNLAAFMSAAGSGFSA